LLRQRNSLRSRFGAELAAAASQWDMTSDAGPATTGAGRILSYVGGWLAIVAMLVLAPFFLASGLMAPLWGVIIIMAIWVGLLVLGIVLLVKRRPLWVLPIPVLALGLWWLIMSLGGYFLGWTP
jgi:hypothetical protein